MGDFYDEVLSHIHYATARERQEIRRELEGHVEDRTEALEAAGYGRAEAQSRSLAAMGDPGEIGAGLDRQYSHLGLWLYRAVNMALVLMVVVMAMTMPLRLIWILGDNLEARWAPERSGLAAQEKLEGAVVRKVDIRAEVGSDILYIYQVAFAPERGEANVYYCNYDKSPFGRASQQMMNSLAITSASGGRMGSGGGGGNGGAYYWRETITGIRPEDQCLYASYDRFGEHIWLEIPLDRGEGAP